MTEVNKVFVAMSSPELMVGGNGARVDSSDSESSDESPVAKKNNGVEAAAANKSKGFRTDGEPDYKPTKVQTNPITLYSGDLYMR